MAIQTLLLASVSVSRYLVVCRPLAFVHAFPRLVKMTIASFILGLGGSIPIGEFYGLRSAELHVCGRVYASHVCHYSDRYDGSPKQVQYSLAGLVGIATAVLVMSLMYILVGWNIFLMRRRVVPAIVMGSDLSQGELRGRKLNNSHGQDTDTMIATKPTPGSSATTTPILNNLKDPRTTASKNTTNLSPSITTKTLHQKGIHLHSHGSKQQTVVVTSHPTICFNVATDHERVRTRSLAPSRKHASPKSALPGCKLLFLVTVTFLLSWTPFWVVRILTSADFQTPL